MSKKPVLCLDFDGVIHSYMSGWQGMGVANDPPTAGAVEFLHEATRHFREEIYARFIEGENQRGIMEWCFPDIHPESDANSTSPRVNGIASRLALCWNACRGLSDEEVALISGKNIRDEITIEAAFERSHPRTQGGDNG